MRRNLATLTLSLILLGTGFADEPVLRVQSIKPASGGGTGTLMQQRPTDKTPFRVSENSTGYVKDHYITDKNTIAALEFLIGGRVGVNKDTDIEIVNERSVADGKTSVKRIILKNGSLWVKADAKALKEPIEIQTNGGVMGIKGTEFTAETQTDGTTRVCCFESNSDQGGVEIRDTKGKVVGIAKPGDDYQLSLKDAPVVKHTDDVNQFRDTTLQRNFNEMRNDPVFNAFYGAVGSFLPYGVGTGFYYANAVANLVADPEGTLKREGESYLRSKDPTGLSSYIPFGGGGPKTPPKPDFPTALTPDAGPESPRAKQTNGFPQFSWAGVEDANGYVVMVGRDTDMREVLFTDRSKSNSINYPTNMRPLDNGTYYWRVIPVNENDEPVQRASQTTFNVVN